MKADEAVIPRKRKKETRFLRPTHFLHRYSQYFGIPLRQDNDKQAGNGGENLGSISYFDSQKSPHTPQPLEILQLFSEIG